MLKSMTGFSRCENQKGDLTCKVEIRSVNNRFIDINTRLPRSLGSLELPLKKLVKSRCTRGSFDISISLEKNGESGADLEIKPNLPLAAQYLNAFNKIRGDLGLKGEVDINTILTLRDIVSFLMGRFITLKPYEKNLNQRDIILKPTQILKLL